MSLNESPETVSRIKSRVLEREQNYEITQVDISIHLKLKNMKAVGSDGNPNEFYKGGEKILKGIYELFKEIEKYHL